jgi:hypothetical protein
MCHLGLINEVFNFEDFELAIIELLTLLQGQLFHVSKAPSRNHEFGPSPARHDKLEETQLEVALKETVPRAVDRLIFSLSVFTSKVFFRLLRVRRDSHNFLKKTYYCW